MGVRGGMTIPSVGVKVGVEDEVTLCNLQYINCGIALLILFVEQ